MKKMTLFFALLFTLCLIPIHSYAIVKLGQTGFKFLDIGQVARSVAMGEAFTVVGNGADALFHNPAGIAKMEQKFDMIVNKTFWIADISYNTAGIAVDLGIYGAIGVSIISADYGIITGTRVAGTEQGYEDIGTLDDVGAFAIAVSYSRNLTDKFAVGGMAKYATQKLGSNLMPDNEIIENRLSTFAYDVGTIFYPGFESFRLGMVIKNFSPEVKYEEELFQLPLTFKMGIAMDILDLFGEHPDRSFVFSIDLVHPRDYSQRVHLGGEFWYNNMIAARVGYKFNYDEEGLTAGIGFNFGGVKLDYAYSEFGVFDLVNRVSLGVSF